MEDETDFLLNPKTVKLVTAIQHLDQPYGQKLAYQTDTTYSHTCKTLTKLREKGIVKRRKIGRRKIYRLTEEGKELAAIYNEFMAFIGLGSEVRPALQA